MKIRPKLNLACTQCAVYFYISRTLSQYFVELSYASVEFKTPIKTDLLHKEKDAIVKTDDTFHSRDKLLLSFRNFHSSMFIYVARTGVGGVLTAVFLR